MEGFFIFIFFLIFFRSRKNFIPAPAPPTILGGFFFDIELLILMEIFFVFTFFPLVDLLVLFLFSPTMLPSSLAIEDLIMFS